MRRVTSIALLTGLLASPADALNGHLQIMLEPQVSIDLTYDLNMSKSFAVKRGKEIAKSAWSNYCVRASACEPKMPYTVSIVYFGDPSLSKESCQVLIFPRDKRSFSTEGAYLCSDDGKVREDTQETDVLR